LKYRTATILAAEAASTAATKTIDLDLTEVISRIHLNIRLTNGNNTLIAHPAKVITKLEIVDGSDVLFSLNGMQTQAISELGTGFSGMDVISYMSGDQIQPSMSIFFGRKLYDARYAFDPKKFTNPQLKITHNLALGGSTPSAMTLAVYGDLFDEKPVSPEGFLMSKVNYTYTLSASAHKYIDLPVDFPYRMLVLQGISGGYNAPSTINHIKLSENMDKKVVLDHSTSDLLKLLLSQTNPITEDINAYVAASNTVMYTKIGYEGIATGHPTSAATSAMSFNPIAGGQFNALATGAGYHKMLTRGWLPHGCYDIMPGVKDDPEDWYDPSALKSLRLDLTAGSSSPSAEANVITQQLRRY
jgi:hypothetical protein